MADHNERFDHPLLDSFDVAETELYAAGQALAGDAGSDATLERWHPNEFPTLVTQDELDTAGALAYLASDCLTAALYILTEGSHIKTQHHDELVQLALAKARR